MVSQFLLAATFLFGAVAIVQAEEAWERNKKDLVHGFVNMYQPCVVEIEGEYPYRMWFFGWAAEATNPGVPGCDAIFHARSQDLENWEIYCGEGSWDGRMEPDRWEPVLVASENWYDAYHVGDPSVVYRDGKYFMAYSATSHPFAKREGYAADMVQCVMGAESEDGIHWVKSKQPLLIFPEDSEDPPANADRIGDFHRPCLRWENGIWKLWFDYWLPGQGTCMGFAESEQERFLQNPKFRLQHDLRKPLLAGWPNPDIVRVGGTYHSFSDAPGYPGETGWKSRQLREAISTDGIHWKRLGFIAPDDDTEANHVPQAFITQRNNQSWLYLFYSTQVGNRLGDGVYHFEYDRIRAMRRRLPAPLPR